LSRRLGDDPLIRAREKRAKAAQASASATSDSGGQGTSEPEFQSSSRTSYNDVFFKRRAEGITPQQQVEDVRGAPEAPEISEISEIPEIREVAAAPSFQAGPDMAVEAKATLQGAQDTEVRPAPAVSIIEEEVVANLNGTVAGTAARVDAVPEVKDEPASLPISSQAPDVSNEVPKTQKSGGFFKRLFGKFK